MVDLGDVLFLFTLSLFFGSFFFGSCKLFVGCLGRFISDALDSKHDQTVDWKQAKTIAIPCTEFFFFFLFRVQFATSCLLVSQ